MSARHHTLFATAWLALILFAGPVSADPVALSPDVTVDLGGTATRDHDVVADDGMGSVTALPLGTLPEPADVDAYHLLANGDRLFSLDVSADLGLGIAATPADVVRYDGSSYTVWLDASANGIPDGVSVDAVSVDGSGDPLVSFDITVDLGAGVVAHDEDLARLSGVTWSIFFDGSAEGVAASLDLDGADFRPSDGHFFLSFDGSGSIGGVSFDDEDVLEFDPSGPTWSIAYDGSAQHAALAAADVNALPEPDLLLQLIPGVALLVLLAGW